MMFSQIFKAISNHSGFILFSLDRNYRYTFFTPAHQQIMKKIWGADIQIGADMLTYIRLSDRDKARQNFDRALAGEQFTLLETYGDPHLFRTFWENHYIPVQDDEGNIIGLTVLVVDMTQPIEAKLRLEDAQNRLRLALQASKTGIWEWIPTTNELIWTEEVYEIFDLDPRDFKPDFNDYMSRLYPEDRQRVESALKEVFENPPNFRIEHRILDRKGNKRWLACTGMLQMDNQNRPNRLLGVVQDITERVRNLEQLAESQAKFGSVVDNNPMGILIYELNDNHQLILTQVNPSAEKILNIDAEALLGLPIEKAFPGLFGTDIPLHFRNAILQKTTWFNEELQYNEGQIQGAFQVHAFPIGNNRLAVFFLDITDKKRKEKELADWQIRYELLIKASGQVIYDYNVSTGHIQWFGETEKILGFTSEEMGDINLWAERLHPDDREDILKELSRCQNELAKFDVVYRFATKSGDYRYLSERGYFFLEDSDKEIRMLGILEDIHEKKIAELELKRKNQELVKINRELDRFVYSASHDLRAPLASLLGLIHVARLEKSPEKLEELFRLQEKSLARMDRFISDIVNYSRNSRLELNIQPVNLHELIHESFEQLGYMENAKRIRKEIRIQDDYLLHSDPDRLRIIFNNLLSNAIKYADLNKPDPYVLVAVRIDKTAAYIDVQDNGEGIPPEARDKVFDMFYRASVSKSGSGLGLYIVKEVVGNLGGNITLDSEFEKGTTIKIQLPNLTP